MEWVVGGPPPSLSCMGCSRTAVGQPWEARCPAASLQGRVLRSTGERWSWRSVPSPPRRTWVKTPGPTCSTSATGSSQTVGVQHPDATLSTHTRNCTIFKNSLCWWLVVACYRTGPRGQPIGPPESQHPLPEQVADRRSVFILSPPPSSVFFHPLIEFFSTRCSAREKEKQLLESCKCSKWGFVLEMRGISPVMCLFF